MRLGADPEVFLINRNNGQLQSVIGMIGANKYNPKQIEGMPEGFTLQEDNVALEFGIPPAASAAQFVENIRLVMARSLQELPKVRFSKLSCSIFPKEEMTHPAASIFGCEPDFNAWTGEKNEKPVPPHEHLRSAGGHVHVETTLDPMCVVRAMDLCLGVPSVLLDKGEERKKLYGKAGAFRPKPYGVEYRTLSNFWIFRPKLIEWVWKATEMALVMAEYRMGEVNFFRDEIQHAINAGNKEEAQFLINEFNLVMS